MKKIIIVFLTEKGKSAYRAVEEAGKKESFLNKQIARRIAKDKIIKDEPLTVEITVKIPRLAVVSELDRKITQGLEDQGAKEGKDFTIEVKWR